MLQTVVAYVLLLGFAGLLLVSGVYLITHALGSMLQAVRKAERPEPEKTDDVKPFERAA
jgi:hypothetical protein